jgi:putative oxidoreductase
MKGAIVISHYSMYSYALMRIAAGFLFLWHGSQKLSAFPSGMPPGAPPFITYIAGPIELIGGTLIIIGLFTHMAASSPAVWWPRGGGKRR